MSVDRVALVVNVRKAVGSTLNENEEIRKAAAAQFWAMSKAKYPHLVYALGEIMRDNSIPLEDAIRQQASVLMQAIIKPRNPAERQGYAQLWTQQSDSFKKQVCFRFCSAFVRACTWLCVITAGRPMGRK